jgi:hypothetical protein
MKASWITSASALDGGRLQMEHRWREHRHIRVVTIVRPEVGAVEFLARLERDDETQAWPDRVPYANLCWQLKTCPGFNSQAGHFTDFVKRCFIFTPQGRTFLHETERFPGSRCIVASGSRRRP